MPSFKTVRFGELSYNDENVIFLPEGIVGMSALQKWLMLDMGDDVPLKWFQSLDRGDFGFPVSEAYLFEDDYQVPLAKSTLERLCTADVDDLTALIITTIHPGGDRVTGNLLAPLLIDIVSRRGLQLALDDERYTLQREIDYFKFGLAVGRQTEQDGSPDSESAEAMCGNGMNIREPAGV